MTLSSRQKNQIKSSRTVNARFFEGLEHWNQLKKEPDNGYVVFAGEKYQMRGYPHVLSWQ